MRGLERVSKVFIDSRYCLPDGSIEIPNGGVQLEPSNRCWLAEFSCVASWHTIDATNNILYLQEKPATGSSVLRTIALAHGVYDLDTLAAEIETKLNVAGATGLGYLYVTRASTASTGPATGGSTSFKALRIASAYSDKIFCLPSEAVIRQLWILPPILPTNSTNNLFKFPAGDEAKQVHLSGFVDLRRCHSIFIHAPGFGTGSTVGVKGEQQILAKIPVDVGYGMPVNWTMSGSERDSVEVGVHSVNIMKLELRDVAGTLLNTQGSHWSATLVFGR